VCFSGHTSCAVIVVRVLKPIMKVRTRGSWSSVERVGMPDDDIEVDACSQVIRSEQQVFFFVYTTLKSRIAQGYEHCILDSRLSLIAVQ
jgi:hypothetical protein